MVSDAMLLTRALAALGNGDETAELRALLRARLDSCGRFLQEDPRELDLRELLAVMVPTSRPRKRFGFSRTRSSRRRPRPTKKMERPSSCAWSCAASSQVRSAS